MASPITALEARTAIARNVVFYRMGCVVNRISGGMSRVSSRILRIMGRVGNSSANIPGIYSGRSARAHTCHRVVVVYFVNGSNSGATRACATQAANYGAHNGPDWAYSRTSYRTHYRTAEATKRSAFFCVVCRTVINAMLNVVVCHVDSSPYFYASRDNYADNVPKPRLVYLNREIY